MNRPLLYIVLSFIIIACSINLEKKNDAYSEKINQMMLAETNLLRDNITENLQHTIDDTLRTSFHVRELVTALNSSNQILEKVTDSPYNIYLLNDLEQTFMNTITDCWNVKNKYSISYSPFDLSNANPSDTAWFAEMHQSFKHLKSETLDSVSKISLLSLIHLSYLQKLESEFQPWGCGFSITNKPLLFAPQKIWHQNEKAYIIVAESTYDRNDLTPIRFNGQEFNKSFSVKAPTKNGQHEINAEIGVKEKGELRWMPFTYRIIVE